MWAKAVRMGSRFSLCCGPLQGWQDESHAAAAQLGRAASVRRAEEGLGALVGVVEDIAAQKAHLEQDAAAHKRAALAKKRAGDLEGAKDELRQAK